MSAFHFTPWWNCAKTQHSCGVICGLLSHEVNHTADYGDCDTVEWVADPMVPYAVTSFVFCEVLSQLIENNFSTFGLGADIRLACSLCVG